MAAKLPPTPVGVPPGHSFWNDWYEKLRDLINTGAVSTTWANIDFSGSNITDIVNRAHNNLQSLQGGTAGEYYHLTSAQHTTLTALPTISSGTYTPTLTNVANLSASTAYQAQYIRIGATVTVSGRVDIDPTAATTSTQLGISLPVASNFGAVEDCAGVAFASGVAGQGAAILADAANDRAQLQYISGDVTNQAMYFTFTYQVI
jgi:hypothetical protein